MRRTIISVLALVWFSGCVMIPDYQRPEAPVPKDLPSKEAGSGSAAAELPWREFIQDPELRQLIELALENNRDLRLAALNVEQVRALYKIQREELYPSIYAGGSGTRSGTSRDLLMPNQPRTTEVYHANLSLLAWELDFFGRLRSLSEKALQEYFATEQARSAAQILLISSVANGYLALAAERES